MRCILRSSGEGDAANQGSHGDAATPHLLLESGSPDGVNVMWNPMPMGEMLHEPPGGQGPLCPGVVGKSHLDLFL